jgi:hypothetical protein
MDFLVDFEVEIPDGKIIGYLLNTSHADGGQKAEFFIRHGLSTDRPDVVVDLLKGVLANHRKVAVVQTIFGTKFVVDGVVKFPSGREYLVRSVWINESGTRKLKLVTAYRI